MKRSTKLSEAELDRVHEQLRQENVTREAKPPYGPRPWDSPDERQVLCLICGVWMQSLGSRGAKHKNHLHDEHDGMSPEAYTAHCKAQGWGEAPVTSLVARRRTADRRKNNPKEVKDHNQQGEQKRKARRKVDPAFARRHYDRVRKSRQKKLTDAKKADLVQCPLLNANGEPCGAYLSRLITHIHVVHGMSTVAFKRAYPDVPLSVPGIDYRPRLKAARDKQFGAPIAEAEAAVTAAARADVAAKQAELDVAKAKLVGAERRQLLSGKPAWMQVGGNFLLDNPLEGNPELFAYLDKMGVRRRDGQLWAVVGNKPTVKNDVSDLRGLVGVPGRIFGRKTA